MQETGETTEELGSYGKGLLALGGFAVWPLLGLGVSGDGWSDGKFWVRRWGWDGSPVVFLVGSLADTSPGVVVEPG